MTAVRKLKVSLTLSADLVARADRDAKILNDTRSGVIERWLRRAVSDSETRRLHDATLAYYESLTPEDRGEDEAWAKVASRAAQRIDYDAAPSRPPAKQRRR